MTYKFSVPMPYEKKFIDKLKEINNEVIKSKIDTLYFAMPYNCIDFTGFEISRYGYNNLTDFEFWKPLIAYTLEQGFDFIYLLNSPKIYLKDKNIEENLNKLDKLVNNLKSLGCNKIRVANSQLIEYLNRNYKDINIFISTSKEFQSIQQYSNLFLMFKNIKEFVPSYNLNKNFYFLKNIKKKFPNIEIEIMVNEGCISFCPMRNEHNNVNLEPVSKNIQSQIFNGEYFIKKCSQYFIDNIFEYLCKCNVIYPWELAEYKSIGINRFKLVGRNNYKFFNGEYFDYYKFYLQGVDDIQKIKNIPIRYLNHYMSSFENFNFFTVSDIQKYLPKINHFKKYGHLCNSKCEVQCRYCCECAEKIKKVFEKKQKELQKRTMPFCIMQR